VGGRRENLGIEASAHNLLDEDAWSIGGSGVDFSQQGLSSSRQGIGLVPQQKRQLALRVDYSS
jgi:hypothetical protein